jgi:hypothetical protein
MGQTLIKFLVHLDLSLLETIKRQRCQEWNLQRLATAGLLNLGGMPKAHLQLGKTSISLVNV